MDQKSFYPDEQKMSDLLIILSGKEKVLRSEIKSEEKAKKSFLKQVVKRNA